MTEAIMTTPKTEVKIDSPIQTENSALQLQSRSDGQLWTRLNGKSQPVTIQRCFPWSDPLRYVSLRNHDGEEVALIANLTDLDGDSGKALAMSLAESGFAFEIDGIEHLEEDFEVCSWQVSTVQGSRRFQTKLDDWPLRLPNNGWLIQDVANDLFLIRDPATLDPRSRKLLEAFIG